MTLDFNATASLSGQVAARIDRALQAARADEKPRDYLGASRLGVECERALQFAHLNAELSGVRLMPVR